MTPELWEVGLVAQSSGHCPLCDSFIKKNVSRISPLPGGVGLPLDPASLYYGRDGFVDRGGRPVRLHSRKWVHAACLAQVDDDPEALLELAAERRERFAAMRRQARVEQGRKGGRR